MEPRAETEGTLPLPERRTGISEVCRVPEAHPFGEHLTWATGDGFLGPAAYGVEARQRDQRAEAISEPSLDWMQVSNCS